MKAKGKATASPKMPMRAMEMMMAPAAPMGKMGRTGAPAKRSPGLKKGK
ncbi:MAG TPA: hypothetical protein VF960_10840 [Chloroflexota bacterium]